MDMIVKLYELPPSTASIAKLEEEGITIRRALSPEKHIVLEFVRSQFGEQFASETEVAFAKQPTACFIATAHGFIVGWCAYDSTCKAFLGPAGVHEGFRRRGVGQALLHEGLRGLLEAGYAYAILGSANPEMYSRWFNAIPIPDSKPGWYKGLLKKV